MKTQTDNTKEQQEYSTGGTATIADNRSSTVYQRKLRETMNASAANKALPVQRKANNTGLSDQLKSGIENLSGYAMDDVKVHYNSSKPAQLQAHAYAQGTDIHLAPGQEKHLPHEAWHVVQQKQGRVKPTKQLKGKINVNNDDKLEQEADIMGRNALGHGTLKTNFKNPPMQLKEQSSETNVIQRVGQHTETITLFAGGTATIQWNEDEANAVGKGAMGSIYKTKLNDRDVVIKKGEGVWHEIDNFRTLYPSISREEDPSIIMPIGYKEDEEDGENDILVLEKADGSLNNTLPVDLQTRLSMIKDIWHGLKLLHKSGIEYKDMSQKNTLFKGRKALLTDFGTSFNAMIGPLDGDNVTEDNKRFIKTSCNILLGHVGDAKTDLNMDTTNLQRLRNLLKAMRAKDTDLDAIERIAQLTAPTNQNCMDFISHLNNCIKDGPRARLIRGQGRTPTRPFNFD